MSEFISVALELIQPENLLSMNIGMFVGIIVGALPGLNPVIGITLMLPFTYTLESVPAILLLLGVYCGATYGGSITAILINTPGTGAAMATMIEGYPMAQQGRAGDALKAALVASTFGGILSCLCLMFLAPTISSFALNFHSADYFSLCLFGLCMVVSISGDSILKGLIMAGIGLTISTVGIDTIDGIPRFMFGKIELLAGIPTICVMMGAFALGNCYTKCFNRESGTVRSDVKYQKATLKTVPLVIKNFWLLLRSSLMGSFIGAVPGTGAAVASYMSYNVLVGSEKNEEEKKTYGNGNIKGILAPEAANNGVTGATLIPMLTLGIPGDNCVAIIGSALILHGITPGPTLFRDHPFWVYCLMGGLLLVNIFMLIQGSYLVKAFANISKLPMTILIPCIMVFCVVGVFTSRQYLFDIFLIMGFSVMGYFLRRCGFPLQPMTIGLVLGQLAEQNFRRALIIADGDVSIFFTRPISLVLLIICAICLCWPRLKKLLAARKAKAAN